MGDDGTGWDADVPISRCVSEVTCYNPAPHPAVSNLRAAKVGGAGDFDNSSNFGPSLSLGDPRPRPLQVLARSSVIFVCVCIHLLVLNRRCQLSVGRTGLSPPPPPQTRKKANTFNAPSNFVPLDRNCQTDICIPAFLSVPISAQMANTLEGEGRGGWGNKCQF